MKSDDNQMRLGLKSKRAKKFGIKYYLHVHKQARKQYQIPDDYFSITGNLVFANLSQARRIADNINSVRQAKGGILITPGLINSAALFHELMHFVIQRYDRIENPNIFSKAYDYLLKSSEGNIDELLNDFINDFPPPSVYSGKENSKEYLSSFTNGYPNKLSALEELLILHIENLNPGLTALKELFDDTDLQKKPAYQDFVSGSRQFFSNEKTVGDSGETLIDFLSRSFQVYPNDIQSQLHFMLERWRLILPQTTIDKILLSDDLTAEDQKIFIGGGPAPSPEVPNYQLMAKRAEGGFDQRVFRRVSIDEISYSYYGDEAEQFTQDLDWMPRVVMMAKNIYVWLDQLSKKYQREIRYLNEIPDEELDVLQSYHINALWLIGVWERSPASKKIKQFCGNHDAVSSAYSVYDYEIAQALGGYLAVMDLKRRCSYRGIRLASDMVPNHTGIFSKWLLEHPDFYIQSESPPYSNYSFTGPDLSDDHRYQIRIEDKYYTRKDAAVVFELRENESGRARYIYHGNDGTNMPWNDTAQLNVLIPQVRESLIQQIKRVAELFPIIRFDAAMTLTKRHFQRLWYPQPGTGGAIPSRSDYALSKESFDLLMPEEFWRDVVERMNAEMPDTLLLAEAFWLMEGYFVRTLGMHRVYNSAFMHMLMKEENQKYRELIKNTLEYNPEILKRYVNFMSNPDEETAVNQFGKGDKYFGVCVILITSPGLPLFAHGQIEGFTEKYGMEYQRAYLQETADHYLIERHKREIFPLLTDRALFSEVRNFWLFDFILDDNSVDENVIAYSNSQYDKSALVVYNNGYERKRGRIYHSTQKISSDLVASENPRFETRSLLQSLQLKQDTNIFYSCYESKSNLFYLISSSEIAHSGWEFFLNGYEYKIYSNFLELYDTTGEVSRLWRYLNGGGVVSIENALQELRTRKLHYHLSELFSRNNINTIRAFILSNQDRNAFELPANIKNSFSIVLDELVSLIDVEYPDNIYDQLLSDLIILGYVVNALSAMKNKKSEASRELLNLHLGLLGEYSEDNLNLIIIFLFIQKMFAGKVLSETVNKTDIYKKILLQEELWQTLIRLNDNYYVIKKEFELLLVLLFESGDPAGIYRLPVFDKKSSHYRNSARKYFVKLLEHSEIRTYVGYNIFQDTAYFNKENLENLLKWNLVLSVYEGIKMLFVQTDRDTLPQLNTGISRKINRIITEQVFVTGELIKTSSEAGYRFYEYISKLNAETGEDIEEKIKSGVKKIKRTEKLSLKKKINSSAKKKRKNT